jgi:hypothetical protein
MPLNSPAHSSSSDSIQSAVASSPWQTRIRLDVFVDVPDADATNPDEATAYAMDLFAALELRVSLGGVPLKASLSGL